LRFFWRWRCGRRVFYESVNFAVLKKLPVLFICENNLYSVYSHLKVRQPEGRKIYKMVEAMGCQVIHGDGNNALEVYEKVKSGIELARAGKNPVFLSFKHTGGENIAGLTMIMISVIALKRNFYPGRK